MKLFFLGSGGGRISTALGLRYSAGFIIEASGVGIYVDPGPHLPCALKDFKVKTPVELIILSHPHIDHVAAYPWLVERGFYLNGRRPLTVAFNHESMQKFLGTYSYLEKDGLTTVRYFLPGESFKFKGLEFTFTPTEHTAPGFGFLLKAEGKTMWYSGDTLILAEHLRLRGLDLAVLNVTFPPGRATNKHMTLDQALRFIEVVKPKIAVITHLGRSMQTYLAKKGINVKVSGTKIIVARDGLELSLGEENKGPTLESFLR